MTAQIITLLGGRVKFVHTPQLYAPTSDAVWAASAVEPLRGEHLFEPGFGTGALGLCLLERLKDLNLCLTALELQENMCLYARKNINLNGRMARVQLIRGDVAQSPLSPNFRADHSVANPPFYVTERGFEKQSPTLRTAHGLTEATLGNWLHLMADHTKQNGTITLINHSHNLPEMLAFAKTRGLGVEVIHIATSDKRPAKRVIVRYTGSAEKHYTFHAFDEAAGQAVLRQGASIWQFVSAQ
ncbi:MAG: N-6 DNA methylase [Proteobacteria bacterium]|nr:N-6 DNA methylase [Pseudomonadota bacterium]